MILDLYLVYQFIRRLTTPFIEWDAYKYGVIDKDGNILKNKSQRKTQEEKDSLKTYDVMILNLKRLLEKLPGGSSKLASYAAALWLIREWNHFSEDSLLTEDLDESVIIESLDLFLETYFYYTTPIEDVNKKVMEDGIAMSAGSGAIAGIGIGPQGEPGLTRAQQKKHRNRAAATQTPYRKSFVDFIKDDAPFNNVAVSDTVVGEPGTGDTAVDGYRPKKKYKKQPKQASDS